MVAIKAKKTYEALRARGLACTALPAADTAIAARFYQFVLGLPAPDTDVLPELGAHVVFKLGSSALLACAKPDVLQDLKDTGVHCGLRVGQGQRKAIAERLGKLGVEVHAYREDREAEQGDNFYFFDPEGNRVQIVENAKAAEIALDHAALLANDILWAEDYYVRVLGLAVEGRVGWNTADHAQARRWAAGEDDMAPGTRRLDKLYMTMGGKNEVPRANMQMFLPIGSSTLVVYLATRHFQEPPEGQVIGAPRIMIATTRSEIDRLAGVMHETGWPCRGPVAHGKEAPFTASLYLRDPSGNFIELCAT